MPCWSATCRRGGAGEAPQALWGCPRRRRLAGCVGSTTSADPRRTRPLFRCVQGRCPGGDAGIAATTAIATDRPCQRSSGRVPQPGGAPRFPLAPCRSASPAGISAVAPSLTRRAAAGPGASVRARAPLLVPCAAWCTSRFLTPHPPHPPLKQCAPCFPTHPALDCTVNLLCVLGPPQDTRQLPPIIDAVAAADGHSTAATPTTICTNPPRPPTITKPTPRHFHTMHHAAWAMCSV